VTNDAIVAVQLDGQARVDATDVAAAAATLDDPYGTMTLTLVLTVPYFDDCAKPISTQVTWTGTVTFIQPPN
jgi:hypothetical protein